MSDAYYVAGVCNINDFEVAYRKKGGYFFAFVTFILVVSLLVFQVHPLFGLSVMVPAWLASLQFIQVRNRFCSRYGLAGKYSSGKQYKQVSYATLDDRAKDRKTATRLSLQALMIATVVSVITIVLLSVLMTT